VMITDDKRCEQITDLTTRVRLNIQQQLRKSLKKYFEKFQPN